jgi:hypothetical protein
MLQVELVVNIRRRGMAATSSATATPFLCVKGAAKAIAFYQSAFGAREISRITDDDGTWGR